VARTIALALRTRAQTEQRAYEARRLVRDGEPNALDRDTS